MAKRPFFISSDKSGCFYTEENVSVKFLEEVFLGIIFMVCFFMLTFCFSR